jgi:serine protease Do
MVRRPRVTGLVVLSLVAAVGCRRKVVGLDEVQTMAYATKPAVVRISAYATGQFLYTPAAINAVAQQLLEDGHDLQPRQIPAGQVAIDTGAGGSGSGFIIHPDGWILTSGHVVTPTRDAQALDRELRRNGAIAALVKHFPVDALRSLYRDDGLEHSIAVLAAAASVSAVKVVNQVELSNGEALPFRLVQFTPSLADPARGEAIAHSDLALIRIDRHNLPALPLGDAEETRVGESIWSVGYPAVASSTDDVIGGWLSRDSDLEATFNPGIITAIKTDSQRTPVFQTNVAIYRGNSGGPAVNRNGEAIGISTWGHTSAEQIKFLVPIDVARKLLASSGVTPSADGEFNRAYRAALQAAGEGRWTEAKSRLAEAAVFFPNSPDLMRFRRDTERATKSLAIWQRYPSLAAAAVALLVLVLLIATWLALRTRTPHLPKELAEVMAVPTKTSETVLPGDAAPGATPRTLGRFTFLNGARAGQKLGLGGSGIRIGRESAICEIVLENPKVSRLHAEVVSIDGKVLLIDRNSSNGTFVNDHKIDKRVLRDGDIIYFGGRNAVAVAFHA